MQQLLQRLKRLHNLFSFSFTEIFSLVKDLIRERKLLAVSCNLIVAALQYLLQLEDVMGFHCHDSGI